MIEKLYKKISDTISNWNLTEAKVVAIVVQQFDEYGIGVVLAYQSWNNYDEIEDKEECWNYACWDPDCEEEIIGEAQENDVKSWLQSQGVSQVGIDEEEEVYDENCFYIGHGPNGIQELIQVLKTIVKRLQESKIIEEKAGKRLPILITDLEYTWYFIDAIKEVNELVLIKDFVDWMEEDKDDSSCL